MRLKRFLSARRKSTDEAPASGPKSHSSFDALTFRIPEEVHDVEPAPLRDYLTIATIVRNEAPYMREWAAFHLAMGAGRLLIYDNGSTDDLAGAVSDFTRLGLVKIIPWPHFIDRADFLKTGAAHAIAYTRRTTRWLACIDADEFLFSPTGARLPEVLRGYEDLPALIIYWVNFGTSGHAIAPAGLVTESYHLRAADPFPGNLLHKSILNPAAVRSVWGSHRFGLDCYPVVGYDEDRTAIVETDKSRTHRSSILRINHYYSRSQGEFDTKLNHGFARYKPSLAEEKRRFLRDLESDQVEDNTIQRLLPLVRRYLETPELALGSDDGPARPPVPAVS